MLSMIEAKIKWRKLLRRWVGDVGPATMGRKVRSSGESRLRILVLGLSCSFSWILIDLCILGRPYRLLGWEIKLVRYEISLLVRPVLALINLLMLLIILASSSALEWV